MSLRLPHEFKLVPRNGTKVQLANGEVAVTRRHKCYRCGHDVVTLTVYSGIFGRGCDWPLPNWAGRTVVQPASMPNPRKCAVFCLSCLNTLNELAPGGAHRWMAENPDKCS